MAGPKLLLEVGTIGIEKVNRAFRTLREEMERVTGAEEKLAGARTRAAFRSQQGAVDKFRQSLGVLRAEAARLGQGGEMGTVAASFKRFEQRLTTTKLSSQQLSAEITRMQQTFLRAEGRIEKAGGALNQFGTIADKTSKQTKKATVEKRNMNEALKDVSSAAVLAAGPLSGIGARIIALGAIARRAGFGIAIFFGSIAVGAIGLAAMLKAGAKMQVEMAKIEGVLRATGKAAFFTAESIRAVNEEIVGMTLGGNIDEINDASALLLTFANTTEKNFKDLMLLSADLAAAGFGSIAHGAEIVGLVMESPTAAIERLNRRIPIFRGALGDTIRTLDEFGRTSEAAALIINALEDRVGGLAEEMNTGIMASLGRLSQSVRNLFEKLSDTTGVVELFTGWIDKLEKGVAFLNENIEATAIALIGLSTAITAIGLVGLAGLVFTFAGGWVGLAAAIGISAAVMLIAYDRLSTLSSIQARAAQFTKTLREETDELTQSFRDQKDGAKELVKARIDNLRSDIKLTKVAIRLSALRLQADLASMSVIEQYQTAFRDRIARELERDFGIELGREQVFLDSEALQSNVLILNQMQEALARLETALESTAVTAGGAGDAFDDVQDFFDELNRNIIESNERLEAAKISDAWMRHTDAIQDTRATLRDFSSEELAFLANLLGVTTGEFEDAVTAAAKLKVTADDTDRVADATEEWRHELRDLNGAYALLDIPKHNRDFHTQVLELTALARAARMVGSELMDAIGKLKKGEVVNFTEDFLSPTETYLDALQEIDKLRAWANQTMQGEELVTTLERLDRAAVAAKDKLNDATEVDDLDNVQKFFDELNQSIIESGERLEAAKLGDSFMRQTDIMQDARAAIRDFSKEELAFLAKQLGVTTGKFEDIAVAVVEFMTTVSDDDRVTDSIVKWRKELEDAVEVWKTSLSDVNDAYTLLNIPKHNRDLYTQALALTELAYAAGVYGAELTNAINTLKKSAVKGFTEGLLTPTEKYLETMQEIDKLRAWAKQTMEAEELAIALDRLDHAAAEARRTLIEADPLLSRLNDGFDLLGETIVNMATEGENALESLREIARKVVVDILNDFIMFAAINPLKNMLFGEGTFPTLGGGDFLGGLVALAGPLFGAATGAPSGLGPGINRGFATGGRPTPGQMSIVGERGPEPFIPDRPGTIVSNKDFKSASGGGDTFYIDARGADAGQIRRLEEQIFTIGATVEQRAVRVVQDRSGRSGKFLSRGRK